MGRFLQVKDRYDQESVVVLDLKGAHGDVGDDANSALAATDQTSEVESTLTFFEGSDPILKDVPE